MKNGFTLLELLVVIAIIGGLSTLMLPNFVMAQERAKETSLRSVALSVQNAIENYGMDQGSYPGGAQVAVADLSDTLKTNGYLKSIPKNPYTGKSYQADDEQGKIVYSYQADSGDYLLTAYKRDGKTVLATLPL